MKAVWNVLVLALAINFLLLAGGVGWLFKTGKLDHDKVQAIRDLVFPNPPPAEATTQPAAAGATTQPFFNLDELLARHLGQRAGDQVEAIQHTIDAQSAQLDRRRRELEDLQAQVATEQKALAEANGGVEAERKRLAEEQRQTQAQAEDKGFEDSLKLYSSMQGKQVKQIFLALPDDTVVRYLEAMPPRSASRIMREFKSPAEVERIHRIMERMRQGQPTTRPADESVASPAPGGSPAAPSELSAQAKDPREPN